VAAPGDDGVGEAVIAAVADALGGAGADAAAGAAVATAVVVGSAVVFEQAQSADATNARGMRGFMAGLSITL
jgi:hypothetical protein